MYFGGVIGSTLTSVDVNGNFLLSTEDQNRAYLLRVAWEDDGDGVAGHHPSPTDANSIVARNNKTEAGQTRQSSTTPSPGPETRSTTTASRHRSPRLRLR
jgi:hypothetical protein